MRASRALSLTAGLVTAALGISACTSILGDFSDSSECTPGTAGCAVAEGGAPDSTTDGGACTGPGAPSCGAHGSCVEMNGAASCACKTGYSGATCAACASGYLLSSSNQTCTPACASANLTCPAHGTCDDSSGTAKCVCATGYTLGAADAAATECNWTGGPLDPNLVMGSPPWVVAGGAIDTTAAGEPPSNVGVFSVPRDVICANPPTIVASLSQTFPMPTVSQGQAFALHVVDQLDCGPVSAAGCNGGSIPFTTSLNYPQSGTNITQATINTWQDHQFCLGEKGYGPSVALSIGQLSVVTGDYSYCNDGTDPLEFQIDVVNIQPSTTCPAVGTVANGDFESTTPPWTSVGTAQVAPGIGTNGSQAGRLTATTGCPSPLPALISQIAVPSMSMPNAQLTFSFNGPTTRTLAVTIAGIGVNVLSDGSTQTVAVCLPEYAKGYSIPFQVEMENEMTSTGACAGTVTTREMIVDDFAIVSNATACPSPALIEDPGFEKEPLSGTSGVYYWQLTPSTLATLDTSSPHTGSADASLLLATACQTATASTTVTVPAPVGTAGPVVNFFYQLNTQQVVTGVTQTYGAVIGTTNGPTLSDTGDTWTASKLCIPPSLAGLGETLSFVAASSGVCSNVVNGEFSIDDVSLGTDPSCPAQ